MMKPLRAFLVLILIVSMVFPVGVGAENAAPVVTRISGADRYATAVEISKQGWSSSAVVIIARGDDYADALAGVPLAYRLGVPILLVSPTSLPAVTRQEIQRLGAAKAYILGGVKAVNNDVDAALRGMGLTVERIAGSNRYDTAARIAAQVSPYGSQAVVIANGHSFPDALSAAPYAAVAGYPVLLVERDSIPAETSAAIHSLGISESVVIGGTSVVSNGVMLALPGSHRIWGADRYATSVALARHFNPKGTEYFVATGRSFADAITGGVLAARQGTGLILTDTTLPSVVSSYLAECKANRVTILGGTGAVSAAVANAINNRIAPATGHSGVAGWTTPGATVRIAGKSVIADDSGKYQVSGISADSYTAAFSLDGYGTREKPVTVQANKTSVLSVTLNPQDQDGIYLTGAVVDKATGQPVAGAKVNVEVWDAVSGKWVEETVLTTDAAGIYTLINKKQAGQGPLVVGKDVLRFGGRCRLTIGYDVNSQLQGGYHSVTRTVDLRRDDVANVLDGVELVKIKPMTLTGRVTLPDNTPVQNQVVWLNYGERKLSCTTNANGDYFFNDVTLPSGRYGLWADPGNVSEYAVYSVEVNVSEGKDLTHNVRLVRGYRASIVIRPGTDSERFRTDAEYTAVLQQGTAAVGAVSVLSNGETLEFGWDRVAPGSYSVRVAGDYVIPKSFNITVQNADFVSSNQRVTRAGVIKGKVAVESTDVALADARVELLDTLGRVAASTTAASDGSYSFGNLIGNTKYTVRAAALGYRTRVSGQLTIAVNEAVQQDFNLPKIPDGAKVSGYVQTMGTLHPAQGARMGFRAVSVRDSNGNMYPVGKELVTVNVGSNGAYSANLSPGVYTLVISDPGKHETMETTITVVAGDVFDSMNYRLAAGGNARLAVVVKDSLGRNVKGIKLADKWGETLGTVGSGGMFEKLSAGTYTISAAGGASHEDLVTTVTISKGANISRSYTLVPSAKVHDVGFWVMGESNQSLSGVRIFVTAGTEVVAEGATNTGGRLTVRLPAGNYTASIYADGYIHTVAEFKVISQDLVVPVIRLDKW